MKIGKMLWISALILVIGIPSVFAQEVSPRNPWVVLAINTAIIWVILFLLQYILMPEKSDKEKAILWIATFGLSFIIAWVFIGSSGFIWEVGAFAGMFNPVVIVNTILISGVVYFSLGLLGVPLESKQGKVGALLLITFIAAIISLRLESYVWNTQTLQQFYNYLLGEKGILSPEDNRLYVFIGSAVLLSWFFVGFLKMGEGYNKLSYAMALIIAADIAKSGTTTDTIIKLGELLSIIVLGKQLGGKWYNYFVAVGLVLWISYIVFPGRGVITWFWQNAFPYPWRGDDWRQYGSLIVSFIFGTIGWKAFSRWWKGSPGGTTGTTGGTPK
ncbi:MAG: hypothetical protein AABX33_05225 [Nanoarchaeota archaeon]